MSGAARVSADGSNPAPPIPPAAGGDAESPPDITGITKDLVQEEYKQRRQEISDIRARMEGDSRYSLVLTGALWLWLAANQTALAGHGQFVAVVVFMPAALMLFFFYRWYAMHKSVFANAAFLRELEDKTGLARLGLGWETGLRDKRAGAPLTANLVLAGVTFWVGLSLVNLLLGVLFGVSRGWFGG